SVFRRASIAFNLQTASRRRRMLRLQYRVYSGCLLVRHRLVPRSSDNSIIAWAAPRRGFPD
ncbi:MAG: hypothetical protein K2J63_03310, partial [Muribaculaceae bacterium]|nr:hypothetical protein [Muribaculaceae bacterium]